MNRKTRYLTQGAVIASLYVALTFLANELGLSLIHIYIETDSEDVICDVDIMMTNCYVDFHAYSQEDESRVIALEIHGVAQCAVYEKKSVPYVEDVYKRQPYYETCGTVPPV